MAEDRPLCRCHGEPMTRNGHNSATGPQRWMCVVERRRRSRVDYWQNGGRESKAALYRKRRNAGLCTRCGADDPIEAVCWKCLNDMEARHAVRI